MNSQLVAINLLIFVIISCTVQETKNTVIMKNRKSHVAGTFYPAGKEQLQNSLRELFAKAEPEKAKNTAAIISPHAGYVYSGLVAASAFNQIDTATEYDNVFIIATSHQAAYHGASLFADGNYETPLGEVKVNIPLAKKLAGENKDIFHISPEYHLNEHSVEVQLPFLQHKLGDNIQIVPIIIGTSKTTELKRIAEALKKYLSPGNLFVISTDFSHYPSYNDAISTDSVTCGSILTNNPATLLKVISENEEKNYPGMVTSLCGWSSVLTFMYMTENNSDYKYVHIHYQNSGDARFGDRGRVVGYNAIAVLHNNETADFSLSDAEKKNLLKIARNTVEEYILNSKEYGTDTNMLTEALKAKCGAFVSIHKNEELRGCLGRFTEDKQLYRVIQDMAIASVTRDTRFKPVDKKELNEIDIEISVLTPMKKISSEKEISLGKHGIYIKKGFRSGTFLPQVATQTGWTLEEFLGHCSRDKAGLGWDEWKSADVYIYEAIVFSEKEFK